MLSSPTASPLPAGIHTGSVVANRYRIEAIVGRGGMGVVVAARHLELDERVAVKFMSHDALGDPEAVARFDREVRAAARLRSEYVARVFDAGKLTDGSRYMVLEYLEGEDLSARVQREGPLELGLAIRFMLQTCAAVFEAHLLGIVHRDLKPANLRVVLRADGSEIVKVLDFGVMKRLTCDKNDTLTADTQPGTVIGTPFYTSPEQLRGKADVDVRSDIWSLGATLFELLTGKPPFDGKTYPQVIAKVLEAAPQPLRSLRPDLPSSVEGVVMRCLEKVPSARYGNVVEFACALAETVKLDAELSSLLERLLRRQNAPASAPGQAEVLRSEPNHEEPTPEFAVVASSRRSRPGIVLQRSPPDAQFTPSSSSRRTWLVVASGLVSALLVVVVGLPWLPRFGAKPVRTPSAPREFIPPEPQRVAAPVPSGTPSPAATEIAPKAAPPLASQSQPRRRNHSSEPTSPTRISATNPIEPPPSPATTGTRRNPLLFGPR